MTALSNLAEIEAYLADRADVIDGDYGQPAPNVEMNLQRQLEEARDAFTSLINAVKTTLKAVADNPGHPMTSSELILVHGLKRCGETR